MSEYSGGEMSGQDYFASEFTHSADTEWNPVDDGETPRVNIKVGEHEWSLTRDNSTMVFNDLSDNLDYIRYREEGKRPMVFYRTDFPEERFETIVSYMHGNDYPYQWGEVASSEDANRYIHKETLDLDGQWAKLSDEWTEKHG